MSTDLVKAEAQQLDAYIKNARMLAESSMLPPAYQKQPANVLLAIQTGAPLGFTASQSISGIHVIKGKPTMSADMTAAAIRRAGHKLRITGDDTHAVAVLIRSDDPDFEYRCEWTLERAKKAGLLGNDTWAKYPAAMLRARAITEVARAGASEALYGVIYTPEELGAPVEMNDEGEIVPVETTPATPAKPAKPAQPAKEEFSEEDKQVVDKLLAVAKDAGETYYNLTEKQWHGTLLYVLKRETMPSQISVDQAEEVFNYMRGRVLEEHDADINQMMLGEDIVDAEIIEEGETA